jgi:hypothetical protein
MKGYRGGMEMHDKVDVIGKGSVIQHGTYNDRVYLMKLDEGDVDIIIPELSKLSKEKGYSKIFCKVPKYIAPLFFMDGYILEGFIPKFFKNQDDVFFVSKFLSSDRLLNIEKKQLAILSDQLVERAEKNRNLKKQAHGYSIRTLDKSDVEQITDIYREVS